jgi:hypothetical protein
MSMAGNFAVEAELERLLKFMDDIKDQPAERQLELIRKEIEATISTAKSGWL